MDGDIMMDSICYEIKNYFTREGDKIFGNFTITNGIISPSFSIVKGQYFRIWNSRFNDDVYVWGEQDLKDEPLFHGAIWLMRPPKEFIELVDNITAWQKKYGTADSVAMSPFTSESLGGVYSYSKSTSSSGDGSGGTSWQSLFGSQLNKYRRLIL